MVLTAQQPYYLPNYYFFYKIYKSDIFLFADHLFYRKQSFTTRSVITNSDKKKSMIIPVIKKFNGLNEIKDILIDNHSNWIQKHIKTLEQYLKFAPYFDFYFESFKELYTPIPEKLADFLWKILIWHFKILFPEKRIYRSSLENINTNTGLKSWAKRKNILFFKYYENEEKYYRKNFQRDFNLEKLQINELEKHSLYKYSPNMAFIILLFHLGPEAKTTFKNIK